MMNNINNKFLFRRLATINRLQIMVVIVSGVLSLQWVIFQVIEYFFHNDLWKGNIIAGIIFGCIAISFIAIVFGLSHFRDNIIFKKPTKEDVLNVYKEIIDRAMYDIDDDIFLSLIQEQQSLEKWDNVLRIGEVSSDLFWKMARYDLRISNGQYMLKALEKLLNQVDKKQHKHLNKQKVIVLIDDLGYTYVGKQDFINAENNIKIGLELAESIKDYVLICKAYRHLSGVNLQLAEKSKGDVKNKHIQEAEKNYKEAKKALRFIFNPIKHIEMSAFLHYLNGRINTVKKKYTDAVSEYDTAQRLFDFICDRQHSLKVFYQRGFAYEASDHDNNIVITQYILGYDEAVNLVDNDQILKNGSSICRIYANNNDKYKFDLYYEHVHKVADELKNTALILKLESYKAKLH